MTRARWAWLAHVAVAVALIVGVSIWGHDLAGSDSGSVHIGRAVGGMFLVATLVYVALTTIAIGVRGRRITLLGVAVTHAIGLALTIAIVSLVCTRG